MLENKLAVVTARFNGIVSKEQKGSKRTRFIVDNADYPDIRRYAKFAAVFWDPFPSHASFGPVVEAIDPESKERFTTYDDYRAGLPNELLPHLPENLKVKIGEAEVRKAVGGLH